MALHEETSQPPTTAEVNKTTTSGRQRRRWWLALVAALIVLGAGGWSLQQIVRANSGAAPETSVAGGPSTTAATTQTALSAPQQVDAATRADHAPVTVATTNDSAAAAQLSTANQNTVSLVVLVGAEGATLLAAPTDSSGALLEPGVVFSAVGRTADSGWLAVQAIDGTSGWIAASELVVFGVTRLAIVDPAAFMVNLPAAQRDAVNAMTVATTTVESAPVEPVTVSTTTARMTATTATDPTIDEAAQRATVNVSSGRLNVRGGPGTTYAIVAKANAGDALTVFARNAAADWVQIQLPNVADEFGWVAARYLDLAGDVAALPVSTTVSSAPVFVSAVATTATTAAATTSADTNRDTVQTVSMASAATTASSTNAGAVPGLSGTLVFQSSPGGMIYAYDLANGRLWQLTNGFDPAISPDGSQVAFVREGGENGLYLINLDGSNERLIFSGRESLSSPKWSPDGQWIVFTRRDEYRECVDLGRAGCVSPGTLPPNMATDNLELSKDYEYNLARVDVNGNNYRDIAALESARAADWNEAGIVYQSSAGLQITTDTADATNRLLYFKELQPPVEDPDWQPNGGQVLFVQRHGSHYEIYTMNADGSGATALTRPVTTLVDQMPNNLAPAWSPDGQQIVFLSNRAENNEAGAWRLWVMNADGSNQQPLPIDITINYTYGNEQAVSWGL